VIDVVLPRAVIPWLPDGAVVYANGVEIWRFNMKTGTILATDPALVRALSPAH
jgi:hypothetical protein